MNVIRQSALALAALGLMSCGPLAQGGIGTQLVTAASTLAGRTPVAPPPPQVATDEQIAANPGQFVRVNFRDLGRWDTLVVAGTNGARVTWIGSANLSVTMENGIVVATRGLPRDLMGADTVQTWAAIRAGGGTAERRHDFLDNLDQISPRVLQCSIASMGPDPFERREQTYNTTRFEEKCVSEQLQFTNIYWVNRQGQIIRSLQAVSPDAGYLQIDVF
ncbi:YjbF family lipoprotein [Yoonia vestfoldensis]|uniref:YjbF family lipoprotein n=1 Tax=Yoonia vestfoldensis TaxID=245188 RepID=UPI0013A59FB7|nr:YjbF family lipoprotein [Yoonia vestfoldensis]